MKERELRKVAACAVCGKGIGHGGNILFWRVKIERFGIRADRLRRQAGLEMMLGSVALAQVMGADDDLAESVMEPKSLTVCEPCALEKSLPVAMLAEHDQPEKAAA